MDGLQKSNDLVFVLAATNLPWELDSAMLRRLEKRVSATSSPPSFCFTHFSFLSKPTPPPFYLHPAG